jgi:hypothetical protein
LSRENPFTAVCEKKRKPGKGNVIRPVEIAGGFAKRIEKTDEEFGIFFPVAPGHRFEAGSHKGQQ